MRSFEHALWGHPVPHLCTSTDIPLGSRRLLTLWYIVSSCRCCTSLFALVFILKDHYYVVLNPTSAVIPQKRSRPSLCKLLVMFGGVVAQCKRMRCPLSSEAWWNDVLGQHAPKMSSLSTVFGFHLLQCSMAAGRCSLLIHRGGGLLFFWVFCGFFCSSSQLCVNVFRESWVTCTGCCAVPNPPFLFKTEPSRCFPPSRPLPSDMIIRLGRLTPGYFRLLQVFFIFFYLNKQNRNMFSVSFRSAELLSRVFTSLITYILNLV